MHLTLAREPVYSLIVRLCSAIAADVLLPHCVVELIGALARMRTCRAGLPSDLGRRARDFALGSPRDRASI